MGWSPACASNAFLDTLKLCKFYSDRRHTSRKLIEPASNEYISALAAGMRAQLIVEVSSGASTSTVALAVAARQTGGRLVCILSEPQTLVEAKKVINDIGLKDMVEFRVGDPFELLPKYENIDFSLVDCNTKDYLGLFKLLDVNPRRSMVVANNLGRGRRALGGHVRGVKEKGTMQLVTHPVGRCMEVTKIGRVMNLRVGIRGEEREKGRGLVRASGLSRSTKKLRKSTYLGCPSHFEEPPP